MFTGPKSFSETKFIIFKFKLRIFIFSEWIRNRTSQACDKCFQIEINQLIQSNENWYDSWVDNCCKGSTFKMIKLINCIWWWIITKKKKMLSGVVLVVFFSNCKVNFKIKKSNNNKKSIYDVKISTSVSNKTLLYRNSESSKRKIKIFV